MMVKYHSLMGEAVIVVDILISNLLYKSRNLKNQNPLTCKMKILIRTANRCIIITVTIFFPLPVALGIATINWLFNLGLILKSSLCRILHSSFKPECFIILSRHNNSRRHAIVYFISAFRHCQFTFELRPIRK